MSNGKRFNININERELNQIPFVTQFKELPKESNLILTNITSKPLCSERNIDSIQLSKFPQNKFKYNSRLYLRSPIQRKTIVDKYNDKKFKLIEKSLQKQNKNNNNKNNNKNKNVEKFNKEFLNKSREKYQLKNPSIHQEFKNKFDKTKNHTKMFELKFDKNIKINNQIDISIQNNKPQNENKNNYNNKNENKNENERGFLFRKSNRFLHKTIKNLLNHRHYISNPNCKDIILASAPKFDFSKACERFRHYKLKEESIDKIIDTIYFKDFKQIRKNCKSQTKIAIDYKIANINIDSIPKIEKLARSILREIKEIAYFI